MLVEMLLGEMMVDGGESRGSGGAIAAEEMSGGFTAATNLFLHCSSYCTFDLNRQLGF